MEHMDFVVLGLPDVGRAFDRATRRGWLCEPGPPPIVRALRGEARCLWMQRPDARVAVVVTPQPLPCRAAGWWRGPERVALDHLGLSFHAALASCAVADELVAALVRPPVQSLAS